MKKLIIRVLNSLMKTKDPFLFGTVLFCLMVLAYLAGLNRITPWSAIDSIIKLWAEEEIVIQKAAE